jgi:hypothetical protein
MTEKLVRMAREVLQEESAEDKLDEDRTSKQRFQNRQVDWH